MNVIGTFWALIPPIVAIVLGIITKKVNLSLIIGILVGVLLYTSFNPIEGVKTTFELMIDRIGGNIGIIIFLIMLGMFVYVLNNSGASKVYGDWARRKLKSKKASLFATFFLGIFIFVDDYFNCLTVGTVMSPVTDRHNVSREKLAYIIDTTAAPICMIAPISSWAAAVASTIEETGTGLNGFNIFCRTIPANFYSLLSIVMVLFVIFFNLDYAKMKKYEQLQQERIIIEDEEGINTSKSKIYDLILPVLFLIISCIFCMLYTGGIFKGSSIIEAFGSCDATVSLCMGCFFGLIFTMLLYLPRKIITFHKFMDSIEEGFKTMIPSILILCFAWTLGGICSKEYLDCGGFVSSVLSGKIPENILPMIFFVSSLLLAFATGTSWATFIILVPIAISMFGGADSNLLVLTIASILSGAVCGDHISPISDTTILSSTGAGCNHLNHVSSQAYYGLTVAGASLIGYLFGGLLSNIYMGLLIGFISLTITLTIILIIEKRNNKNSEIDSPIIQ